MDQPTDQPPKARLIIIGIYQADDHTEMRFVKEPWGWRPDIVVNQATEEVSAAPPCYKPTDEVLAALDAEYQAHIEESV
jgi:hypothetical protein